MILATIGHDVRSAIRRLKQAPGFTLASVGTLALGLGLNGAVMNLAYALFQRPLALDGVSDLVLIDRTVAGDPARNLFGFSMPDYLHFRDQARTFEGLAAHYPTSPMHVALKEGGMGIAGSVVTASYFDVLRLKPATGRFFSADEDKVPGRDAVAVISHDLWRSRFGAGTAVLGSSLRINGTPFRIVGVAPEGFRGIVSGLYPIDIWIPSAMFRTGYRYCDALARGCPMVNLVGRLAKETSREEAQSEMDVLAGQLASTFPATNKDWGASLRPARGIRVEDQRKNQPIVAMLSGASALVLLVASANVAGLLLSRGLRRRKEIAIRLALGARRSQVIRHLLVESLAIAMTGALASLLVASWATELLRGFFGMSYTGGTLTLDLSLTPLMVLTGLAVAFLTAVLTGIAPALHATRVDSQPALKDETPGAGIRRSPLREGLLVLQVAVSVVLLAGGGLLVRSFLAVQDGPGFDPEGVVMLRLRPSLLGYPAEKAWAFQREAIRRLEALPGVVAASPANVPPLPRWAREARVRLPGSAGDPSSALQVSSMQVGPRYFDTLGTVLVEGRQFEDRGVTGGSRPVIVNRTLAGRLWPQGGALGSALLLVDVNGKAETPAEVVGVVNDLQFRNSLEAPEPMVYLNYWQQDTAASFALDSQTHVRIAGSAALLLPRILREIAAIDPDVPVSEVLTLSERLDHAFSQVRAARTLLLTFGGLALLLSAIGLYGALAFAVGERTREIAIRLVLGAARVDIGTMVFRRGGAVVGFGLAIGVLATLFSGPLIAHLLYGVSPRDPLTLLLGPLVLGAVALPAIWLPARRAMGTEPVTALRSE